MIKQMANFKNANESGYYMSSLHESYKFKFEII